MNSKGEDHDLTASSEAVWSGSALFAKAILDRQLVFEIYNIYCIQFASFSPKKTYELAHDVLVLMTLSSNKGSDEPTRIQ